MKVGRTQQGLDNREVNTIMCSLEGGHSSKGPEREAFQRCVNLDAQKQQTGLV